jgi:hypothetical protein
MITQDDLDRALPLPAAGRPVHAASAGSMVFRPGPPSKSSDVNRLAIASLICGLAGIPLFGVITGLVAILLGALALAAIRTTAQRGLGLALAGLLLGMVDVVCWVIFLAVMLSRVSIDLH